MPYVKVTDPKAPVIFTGKNAKITVGGRPILMATNLNWNMLSEFDMKFSNKYAILASRMSGRFFSNEVEATKGYRHITELCEFLWKLGILKL